MSLTHELVEDHKATLRALGPGCSAEPLIEVACRMLDDVHVAIRFGSMAELGALLAPYLNSHGVLVLQKAVRDAEVEAAARVSNVV
jgi:hypothetical protein